MPGRLSALVIPVFLLSSGVSAACTTDLDCSLNGVCSSGSCACDKPWVGDSCGILSYKPKQPLSSNNMYPLNASDAPKSGPCVTNAHVCDALDTWNGPIVEEDDKFHYFSPLYEKGSLVYTQDMMHGVADKIEGPYTWSSLGVDMGPNPAFLKYPDSSGKPVFSLWVAGIIHVSENAAGPYNKLDAPVPHYPGFNPAPVYLEGKFYLTNQHTEQVFSATEPTGPWSNFSTIDVPVPDGARAEDPFMWIDTRGNWHIINHAYNIEEVTQCGNSTLSFHTFSMDGKQWHREPSVEPYHHAVSYEDGSTHIYSTLERPFARFDSKGQMTHIALAADLMTQDEGCVRYDFCPHPPAAPARVCACANCKYANHVGSVVIALDV